MNSETSVDMPECEVGGYLIRARRTDAWDAIITLLVTLETEHNDYFHAVMQGCRRLSNSRPEIDGLDDLLLAPEQHLHDVAIERERRRSQQGYATPADARAFLQMARQPRHTINPIAAAYFRAAEEEESSDVSAPDPARAARGQARELDLHTSIDAAIELLAEAGMMPAPPRALLEAADADSRDTKLPLLKRLMEFLRDHDEAAYLTRSRELAFLANTLLAGCSVQSRPFTPQEASDAAASVCNLGLECCSDTAMLPDAFLVDHDLVTTFEAGWSTLYAEVSLFVADQLGSAVSHLRSADPETRSGLVALRRALETQRQAGTPWEARDAADVLALLDPTVWVSVLGLLDECPVLPVALTAILERRTTPVSPNAFEFISTRAQLGMIHAFMRLLPNLL